MCLIFGTLLNVWEMLGENSHEIKIISRIRSPQFAVLHSLPQKQIFTHAHIDRHMIMIEFCKGNDNHHSTIFEIISTKDES